MGLRKRAIFVAACAAITTAVTAAATDADTLSFSDRAKLTSAAVELRKAILRADARGVGRMISPSDGLSCTDTRYKKAQVLRYLSNRSSILYQSVFDAARFSRRCGAGYPHEYPATSEMAFFETAPDGSFEIEFIKDGYATIKFTSPKSGYYPREFTFKKEGAGWTLSDGFIIGSCGCG